MLICAGAYYGSLWQLSYKYYDVLTTWFDGSVVIIVIMFVCGPSTGFYGSWVLIIIRLNLYFVMCQQVIVMFFSYVICLPIYLLMQCSRV